MKTPNKPQSHQNVILTVADGCKYVAYWNEEVWVTAETEGYDTFTDAECVSWEDIPNLNSSEHATLRTAILFVAKGGAMCMEFFNSKDLWVHVDSNWDVNVFKTEQGFEADAYFVLDGVKDFDNIYELGIIKL